MNKYTLLTHRGDRGGSNFLIKMGCFIFGKIQNIDIYYEHLDNDTRQNNNKIYIIPLFELSEEINNNKILNKTLINPYAGMRGSSAHVVELLKMDIITYFNNHYKNEFYNIMKKKALDRKFELPWKDSKKIICIHIRLEDCAERSDYDGRGSCNYIKSLIEENTFCKYDRKISDSRSLDTQAPISSSKLERFITEFNEKYPEKEIYIITHCNNIPQWLYQLVKKYKLHISHKNNDEYDIWCMIHSDILVLSKSTYSIVAGYYHQGSQVHYPYWGVAASLGLSSKYDKSGWVGYV